MLLISRHLSLLLLTAIPGLAQTDSEWSAFTAMEVINDLIVSNEEVWAATSGGALHFDRLTRSYRRFTRLDGLAGNRLLSVVRDDDGDLWFGSDGQGLSRMRTATSIFDPPFTEFRNLSITDLFADGNRVYVGTERGVSVFLRDKEEVKESYRRLGSIPKDTEVVAITVKDGILFAGTSEGIAWARLDQANLQDPDSWRSIVIGVVRDVVTVGRVTIAATNLGAFRYDADSDRFVREWDDEPVNAVGQSLGRPAIIAESGNTYRRLSAQQWVRVPGALHRDVTAMSRNSPRSIWFGTEQGLRVIGDEDPPPSREPGSNQFYDMILVGDDLWAASVPDDQQRLFSAGVSTGAANPTALRKDGWLVFDQTTGMPNNELVAVAADTRGQVWIGSWGGGVRIRDAGGVFRSLSPDESVIEGIPSASKFVVISDIERDADGFMWLINVLVGIAVVDGFPEQRGFLFRQTDFGLNPGVDLYRMAIAPDGLKWICSRTDGLILLDDGGTPFTAGDDRMLLLNSDFDSRLSSERAFDIVVNAEGVVWLATDSGVNSIHGRYSRDTGTFDVESWQVYNTFDGLPSNEINAVESDDFGNVWVGTESGLTQIDGNRRVAFTLTASNSGLIDNRVKGLLYDRERQAIWIGTFDGLSRLQLSGAPPTNGVTGSGVFPNPFLLDTRYELTFAGLPLGATLRIYNAAGDRVAALQTEPGRATVSWNGLNDSGFLVSSGIYYYVAESSEGTAEGRFAVIR